MLEYCDWMILYPKIVFENCALDCFCITCALKIVSENCDLLRVFILLILVWHDWQVHLILWGVYGNSNTATVLAVESSLGWPTKSNGARLIGQTQLKLKLDQFLVPLDWLNPITGRWWTVPCIFYDANEFTGIGTSDWLTRVHVCIRGWCMCVSYCAVLMDSKVLMLFRLFFFFLSLVPGFHNIYSDFYPLPWL